MDGRMKTHYWYVVRIKGEHHAKYGLPTFQHDDLFSRDEINTLNEIIMDYRTVTLSSDQVRSACINRLRNPTPQIIIS